MDEYVLSAEFIGLLRGTLIVTACAVDEGCVSFSSASLTGFIVYKLALTSSILLCPLVAEMFQSFAEQWPDFAEEYLYSDNAGFWGSPASSASSPVSNGFCADFTPSDHHTTQKKLD